MCTAALCAAAACVLWHHGSRNYYIDEQAHLLEPLHRPPRWSLHHAAADCYKRNSETNNEHSIKTSASARRIHAIRVGAVKTMNNPPPFQGQHLHRWFYASIYSKLLKLTQALNAGGVWKNRDSQLISGQSLLDCHMWSIFWWSSLAYSTWANWASTSYATNKPTMPCISGSCLRQKPRTLVWKSI